ncbi:phosphoribosylaminoimidazolesuccinocarboxamide synthase, partial [archaeon]
SQHIMSVEDLAVCSSYAHALFRHGQSLALKMGLVLVDTKYEFGKDTDGKIVLVDEIHTPDSSRYWVAETYEERMKAGEVG